MRVVDHVRWQRTKIVTAVALVAVAMFSAGGGDDITMTIVPMPSAAVFVTAMFAATWLMINVIRSDGWR